MPVPADIQQTYLREKDYLWGYCYRLVGDAGEAEDLVQETFVRAMERPPRDLDRPWRPWLVRVASNLGKDLLRRRQRRKYIGPWLPTPVETSEAALEAQLPAAEHAGSRYERTESITLAFLVALEALTPQRRAVLLLRDVYDYSTRETAEVLGISTASVKTTLLRARRDLTTYDQSRRLPGPKAVEQAHTALLRLVEYTATGDAKGIETLLSESVRALSDGNGKYHAAKVPVLGRERVALLYSRIAPEADEGVRGDMLRLNGLPAIVAERPDAPHGLAERFVLALDLDAEGRIRNLYTVLAPEKLREIGFFGR